MKPWNREDVELTITRVPSISCFQQKVTRRMRYFYTVYVTVGEYMWKREEQLSVTKQSKKSKISKANLRRTSFWLVWLLFVGSTEESWMMLSRRTLGPFIPARFSPLRPIVWLSQKRVAMEDAQMSRKGAKCLRNESGRREILGLGRFPGLHNFAQFVQKKTCHKKLTDI